MKRKQFIAKANALGLHITANEPGWVRASFDADEDESLADFYANISFPTDHDVGWIEFIWLIANRSNSLRLTPEELEAITLADFRQLKKNVEMEHSRGEQLVDEILALRLALKKSIRAILK